MGIRVVRDDRLDLRVRGFVATEVEFAFTVDGGLPMSKKITSGVDGSSKTDRIRIVRKGILETGSTGMVTGPIAQQPGQLMVDAALVRAGSVIGRIIAGYLYRTHDPGFPGPIMSALDGPGYRHTVSVAADVTPVNVRQALAVTNLLRKVYGFVWLYNCAAQVATRTMNVRVENPLLAGPTGFGGDANARFMSIGTVTLTTGEEGMIYLLNEGHGDGFHVLNDAGSITTNSTATLPVPFPMTVLEEDPVEILFDIGSAHADDRHSIGIFVEDWLVP